MTPSIAARACVRLRFYCAFGFIVFLLFIFGANAPSVLAGPGHDHGPEPAAGPMRMSPRVVATSDAYQFVGIVEGEALVIYLDRAGDNEPVTRAKLEVALDGENLAAEPMPDGTYEVVSKRLKKPGTIEVLITLAEGTANDLLVGSLVIPGSAPASQSTAPSWVERLQIAGGRLLNGSGGVVEAHPSPLAIERRSGLLAGSALLTGLALGLAMARRRRLLAVILAVGAVSLAMSSAFAHEGHDHGADAATVTGNAPQRQPDGSIFLPKPTQRLLEVRTQAVTAGSARKMVRLAGRVVTNPNFTGVVQTTIQGRYQAPPSGIPMLGAIVNPGDLMGIITPSFASIDSSDMAQTLGDLEQKIAIARAKLARQEQLLKTNVVAQAAVVETRLELDGLIARRAKLLDARVRAEELRAPVGGVVASARVVSGQVVSSSDQLFQIIDPKQLLVEALVFDQLNADAVVEAAVVLGDGRSLKLAFVGRSRAMQQQYSLLQFRIVGDPGDLNVGMPVTVLAATGSPVEGMFVPRAALAQAPNGQTVVFVHKEPEVFVPTQVRTEPFDAQTVMILGGVKPGAKIVIRNAPLVNQVR